MIARSSISLIRNWCFGLRVLYKLFEISYFRARLLPKRLILEKKSDIFDFQTFDSHSERLTERIRQLLLLLFCSRATQNLRKTLTDLFSFQNRFSWQPFVFSQTIHLVMSIVLSLPPSSHHLIATTILCWSFRRSESNVQPQMIDIFLMGYTVQPSLFWTSTVLKFHPDKLFWSFLSVCAIQYFSDKRPQDQNHQDF